MVKGQLLEIVNVRAVVLAIRAREVRAVENFIEASVSTVPLRPHWYLYHLPRLQVAPRRCHLKTSRVGFRKEKTRGGIYVKTPTALAPIYVR